MPVQTTEQDYVYYADSAKVEVMASGESSWTDLGIIMGDITGSIVYDEVIIDTANADVLSTHLKNIKVEGAFEMGNLNYDNITRIAGGLITQSDTAGGAVSTIPNQTIAAGWSSDNRYPFILETSSTDDTKLKLSVAPVLTSVTLNHGTPEVLVANADYVVIEDSNSYSGYSIVFIGDNMDSADETDYSITIVYDTNTPTARTNLYAGTSSITITPYQLRFVHTDSAGLERGVEYFKVDNTSGGLQFNFKSANSDTIETLPMTFRARPDTSLTDGRQLIHAWVDTGAA